MKVLLKILVMLLSVTEPGSYVANGAVKIYDFKGNLFYSHPAQRKPVTFNIPRGIYRISESNLFFKLPEFKPLPFIDVPATPTSFAGIKYKVDMDGNPNKASFYPSKWEAIFDPKIANHKYKPCLIFCKGHEEGHVYFRIDKDPVYIPETHTWIPRLDFDTAEHYCDCYSANKMFKNGYNANQVKAAVTMLLSEGNPRIQKLINKINAANAA